MPDFRLRQLRQLPSATALAATLALLEACLGNIGGGAGEANEGANDLTHNIVLQPLSPERCLRRVALALTDQGPSEEERARMANEGLATVVDTYLGSEDFKAKAFRWHQEAYPPGSDSPENSDAVERATIFHEPARIADRIVREDLDYRLLVTADWTVAMDGTVMDIPHPYPAGVLSTGHLLTVERGSLSRNWAGNFIARFLGVHLDPAIDADQESNNGTLDAIAQDPNCAGCHVNPHWGVDDVGAFHRGCFQRRAGVVGDTFDFDANGNVDPISYFNAEGCSPAESRLLGQVGTGLSDMGVILGGSKEFALQSINFFYQHLTGRQLLRSEDSLATSLMVVFRDSGYRVSALIRHIVTDPAYCTL